MLLLLGLVRLFQLGCYCHPQQQDSRSEWVTVVDDSSQCYIDMPLITLIKVPHLDFWYGGLERVILVDISGYSQKYSGRG